MFYALLSSLSVSPTFQDISSLSQAFIQEVMVKPSSGVAQPGHMKSLMRGGVCVLVGCMMEGDPGSSLGVSWQLWSDFPYLGRAGGRSQC